jgi:hypothetical protein
MLISFLGLTACSSMAQHSNLTPERRVALVECDTTLNDAKINLKSASFEMLDESDGFFHTDWKIDKGPMWLKLWPDGVFLKYKVRSKPNKKIEWSEIRSASRSESNAAVDDFFGDPESMIRQLQVRKMICGGGVPRALLPE